MSRQDYDTTHSIETRKYLRTYGLTPPGVDTFKTQNDRGGISFL
jgi:malate dehydrogenase (oxaloacetate-decarboxylating)(NADP+)